MKCRKTIQIARQIGPPNPSTSVLLDDLSNEQIFCMLPGFQFDLHGIGCKLRLTRLPLGRLCDKLLVELRICFS